MINRQKARKVRRVTPEQAAILLQLHLQGVSWMTAVGVGEENGTTCIVVYVKTISGVNVDFLRQGWNGYPVVVRKMGTPRLVARKKKEVVSSAAPLPDAQLLVSD